MASVNNVTSATKMASTSKVASTAKVETANNEPIVLEKWHLAENGYITAWVPKQLHSSKPFAGLKSCYSGNTNGLQIYKTSEDGLSVAPSFVVEYEYIIPLKKIKQWKVKWQWQGVYIDDLILGFNIETHIQEYKDEPRQTLKELIDIINKLNEPPKVPHRSHNFRLSEGIVMCQQCGEFLADLKKKGDALPSCIG
jgi:hypothetical protein